MSEPYRVFIIIQPGFRHEPSCVCGQPLKEISKEHEFCVRHFTGPYGFHMPSDLFAFECENQFHEEDYIRLKAKWAGEKDITKDC